MAKPKLALIPAAQGTKLYSVLPSDGTGDFTFTRGSKATRINAQGLIEIVNDNISRLDYPLIDGVQKGCPHHILEPARTNVIQYSESFSNAYWAKSSNTEISANATTSPDGSLNADTITWTTSGGTTQLYHVKNTTGTSQSLSIFIKYISGSGTNFLFSIGTIPAASINLTFTNNGATLTGVVGADVTSYKIEDYENNWFRVSFTANYANSNCEFNMYRPLGTGTDVYAIYGAQLESSTSYPTSYIPTNGQSGGVTRSAETANGAGNSTTFNDSEGVLMAEISAFNNIGSFENLSLSNGSSASRLIIFYRNTSNLIEFRVAVNNVIQMQFQYTIEDAKTFNKMLIKYKQNDFSVWVNGFELHTDNSGITFDSYPLNNLSFDNGQVSAPSSPFYGNTKQLQYFDSALDSQQLEQLTSWQSFRDMANGQLYTIE